MIRSINLAFRYPERIAPPNHQLEHGLRMCRASESLVRSAFQSHPDVRDRGINLLKTGCTGLMIMDGDQCVSRAWMCAPATYGPGHLPHAVKSLAAFWIFHCATDVNYRRRGLYKSCLRELLRIACADRPRREIFIDTVAENVASRRAIKAVGFESWGVITTYRFPKTAFVLGRWDSGQRHPAWKSEFARHIEFEQSRDRAA